MNGSGYTYTTDSSQQQQPYSGHPDSSAYDPTRTSNATNDPLLIMLNQYNNMFPPHQPPQQQQTAVASVESDDFFGVSSLLDPHFGLSSHAHLHHHHASLSSPPQQQPLQHSMDAPGAYGGAFGTDSLLTADAVLSSSTTTSTTAAHHNNSNNDTMSNDELAILHPWLNSIAMDVPDLSTKSLSGTHVIERVQAKMNDVITKYIPCVLFLVDCQQELRRGIERKRRINSTTYYDMYVKNLPETFYNKNAMRFERSSLQVAYQELQTLRSDASKSIRLGHDAVKSTFLGGMKDGESWGLRKWLSKHGSALFVCTDLECILAACRKLDKEASTTVQLANLLRPMATQVLHQLRHDIPNSYQAHSSAHPYLPYFHRLEHALRAMSQFDPTSDGVICLDDSDDDDVVEVIEPAVAPRNQRPHGRQQQKRKPVSLEDDSSSGESDVEEDLGELATTDWICMRCQETNQRGGNDCAYCGHENNNNNAAPVLLWPVPLDQPQFVSQNCYNSADRLDELAELLESNQCYTIRIPQRSCWDAHKYSLALKLFGNVLRQPESAYLFESVNDDVLIGNSHPPFSHIIKHTICWRDICEALETDGKSPDRTLRKWDLWDGKDLLQAIDLVVLNHLAYGKAVDEGRSDHRSALNGIRKTLWKGIGDILTGMDANERRMYMPTRRSETSGFVIYKIQE